MNKERSASVTVLAGSGVHSHTVVVGVGGSPDATGVIAAAATFARLTNATLEAVHVETPDQHGSAKTVADGLSKAQAAGASVTKLPAPSVGDGLFEFMQTVRPTLLVLGQSAKTALARRYKRSLVDRLTARGSTIPILLVPSPRAEVRSELDWGWIGSRGQYLAAVLATALTTLVATVLQSATNVVSTSILFLFPVIAIAARSALGAALFAVAASVFAHNLVFLGQAFVLDLTAAQSWVMAAVLTVVAVYTNILTSSLRGRVRLSDRSARESAQLAAFAQRLTQCTTWDTTAAAVCEGIGNFLNVETVMFREIDGQFVKIADFPTEAVLEPVDHVAMHWAWELPDTQGSDAYQPGKWQFHPLSTSLGVLAVVGIARPDGQPPIEPEKMLLFSTLLAQASLAQERLRLEDGMRIANRPEGAQQ